MSGWNYPLPPEDPAITEQFRRYFQQRHDAIIDEMIDEAYEKQPYGTFPSERKHLLAKRKKKNK